MASSRVSSPAANQPAAPLRFSACHTRLPSILVFSAAGTLSRTWAMGSAPPAEERVSKTSPRPLTIPSSEVLSLCFTSKASATSLTSPLASWQELAKPWFSAWIFFCRVSMVSRHSLHMAPRATSKA